MVKQFKLEQNKHYVIGQKCIDITNFYTIPIPSKSVGLLKYSNVSPHNDQFLVSEITHKLFRVPCEHFFVLIPLLHGAFNSFDLS